MVRGRGKNMKNIFTISMYHSIKISSKLEHEGQGFSMNRSEERERYHREMESLVQINSFLKHFFIKFYGKNRRQINTFILNHLKFTQIKH